MAKKKKRKETWIGYTVGGYIRELKQLLPPNRKRVKDTIDFCSVAVNYYIPKKIKKVKITIEEQ